MGGKECTQSECCDLRASCTVDSCPAANQMLKALDANFRCEGTTCSDDECCEFFFDGYARTTDYLTQTITNVDAYSTPSDAVDACTLDADCDGITCELSTN